MLPASPVSGPDGPQDVTDSPGPLVVHPADAQLIAAPSDVTLPAGAAFRVAPLLHVAALHDGGLVSSDARTGGPAPAATGHLVLVGHTRVTVPADQDPQYTVVVTAAWVTGTAGDDARPGARRRTRPDDLGPFEDWQPVDQHPALDAAAQAVLTPLRAPTSGDAEHRATVVAKALAERSREDVTRLRRVRYDLERLLATELREAATRTLERLLADLLELSNAASRARDEARECARERLWTWRTDDDAYHAQRGLQDRGLAAAAGGPGVERSWLRTLDAAVRHCQAVDRQLGEETAALRGLLNATATISVTRDARASETFNLVASVGGIMLGLPALVLTLYGASSVLPLSPSNYVVLIPLAVAGLAAAGIAAYLPGRDRSGKGRRFLYALLAVAVTLGLLALAGSLVTADEDRSPTPPASTTGSTP